MSSRDLFLAIDIGTGSVRSALVDANGDIVAFQAKEHAQIVPRPGWAEQRPKEWWQGAVETTRAVLKSVTDAPDRIASIAACGQMHATVLIDARGEPVLDTVPLWNDKRTRDVVHRFQQCHAVDDLLQITANAPSVAWQAFNAGLDQRKSSGSLPAGRDAAHAEGLPKFQADRRTGGRLSGGLLELSF